MFRKGDRVTYKGTNDTGTVASKRGDTVRVQWDNGGIETPVHPLELAHEKDGSILRQESATASEITTQEKEDLMNKNTRITPVTPPAGFRLIIDHGPWHGEYHGPEAHHGNVVVSSRWSCLGKPLIEFDVYSTVDGHSNFDRQELEAIPALIKDVLSQIDQAHAVEVMTAHPVSKKDPRWHTVTEIAVWCDTHKIDAVAGFAAFTELYGAEYGIKGGGDDA